MARILIVDDEKSIRITLSEFLRADGYEVDAAENVDEAIAKLNKGSFGVVVSDIILPGATGVTLLKQITSDFPHIKVVMMTGEPTVDTAVEAVRAGAFDYLSKPVDKAAILKVAASATRVLELEEEKKRLQTENLNYQKNLEKMVKKRTRELNKSLEKLKKAQEQVIRQEKMKTVGQMASGVAHDFNNVLMPIVGFSEMLLLETEELKHDNDIRHMLEMIHSAGQDAKNIVRRLQSIYKAEEEQFCSIELASLIESVISMTMPKWKEEMRAKGKAIDIATDFEITPMIKGNKSELREVFTNLMFNSVDAMPRGGTVTIRLKKSRDESVVCEFSDTGHGMDEKALKDCMEPFFTTKGTQGTGLGLPLINGIVKRHGGNLAVHSTPGQGTTIQMSFPLPAITEAPKDPDTQGPEALKPMKILVIDDEERSCRIITHILVRDGHTIDTALDGREGLNKFNSAEYDLVVTDRAMPEMSGDEVAANIAASNPEIPIIMLTGFGEMMKENNECPEGVSYVMSKPVNRDDLRKVMQKVLLPTSA